MNKRVSTLLIVAMLLCFSMSSSVQASPQAEILVPASQSTYISISSPAAHFENDVLFLGYTGGSSATQVVLVQFNLSSVSFSIAKAKLGMAVIRDTTNCKVSPAGISQTAINVYSMNTNSWTPATATWTNMTTPTSQRGNPLKGMDQADAAASGVNQLTWTDNIGGGVTTLAGFLESRRIAGDKTASLWIEMAAGSIGSQIPLANANALVPPPCTGATMVPTLRLADSSNPDLPTTVTLRTFRSADPAFNWPLIAGGLVMVALAGGYGVYRWRLGRVRSH